MNLNRGNSLRQESVLTDTMCEEEQFTCREDT